MPSFLFIVLFFAQGFFSFFSYPAFPIPSQRCPVLPQVPFALPCPFFFLLPGLTFFPLLSLYLGDIVPPGTYPFGFPSVQNFFALRLLNHFSLFFLNRLHATPNLLFHFLPFPGIDPFAPFDLFSCMTFSFWALAPFFDFLLFLERPRDSLFSH